MSRLAKNVYEETAQFPAWFGFVGFAPLLLVLCLPVKPIPWMLMCLLAGALWLGFKLLTVWDEFRKDGWFNLGRLPAYFVWPGMNVHQFLRETCVPTIARLKWWWALGKIGFGATLIWVVARRAQNELLAGWVGLVGAVFVLHFGLFHLMALILRRAAIPAQALMRNPVAATSLTDFWGRRWNIAFNELAHRYFFRPAAKRFGLHAGTFAAFLFSGLAHDLVISVPAGAGYGLPTAYFLIQNCGVFVERSVLGKRWKMGRGYIGWAFTLIVTAGPVFWLFHPPFLQEVIIPLMRVIGAL